MGIGFDWALWILDYFAAPVLIKLASLRVLYSSNFTFRLILHCLPTSGQSSLRLDFSRSRFRLICSAQDNLSSSVEPKYRTPEDVDFNVLRSNTYVESESDWDDYSLFIFVLHLEPDCILKKEKRQQKKEKNHIVRPEFDCKTASLSHYRYTNK